MDRRIQVRNMSVTKVERRDGPRYIVWWKDDQRRTKNRSFRKKAGADAFDAKIKLAKRTDDFSDFDRGRQSLREFTNEWWRLYAEPYLAQKTLSEYKRYLKCDIIPLLGNVQLRRLTPQTIQAFAVTLREEGRMRALTSDSPVLLTRIPQVMCSPFRFVAEP